MESTLLNFLIGFVIYGIHMGTKKQRNTIRFLAFILTGFLSGAIIGGIAGFPMAPGVREPWLAMASTGLLSGLILYIAEKGNWINRPGIRYIITLILGLLLAGLAYVFMRIYHSVSMYAMMDKPPFRIHYLVFILTGFLIVFGYTFPSRLFTKTSEK